MTLTSGSRLGSYEIAERIGAGGMGEVYRATDTTLGRQVALKILPEAVAQDEERLARFDREAKILATLSHPNIAVIYGVERSTATRALVMELVAGPTLADRIALGPIPVDETIAIATQIAAGVEAAHRAGVIHRDLKPANIKLRDDGIVKVLDFGLAKTLDSGSGATASASMSPTITSPALTVAGVILGTAAYMAPEQARGRRADHRADIWAFGCVLFEMLTAKRPFAAEGDTVSDTVAAVLKSEPEWRALPPDTPSGIRRLLRRCLAKDPRERLHDIADARLELRDAQGPDSEQPLARQATARWPLAMAAVAVVGAVVAAVLLQDNPEPSRAIPVFRAVILPPAPSQAGAGDSAPVAPRLARGLALSPDGDHLVFVAPGPDGNTLLWIRRLDSVSAQPLAGTEGAVSPFWSPDGRRLAFVTGRSLKRIDVSGGRAGTLAEDVEPFSTGSWNREDVILFVRREQIFRISGSGGAEQAVTRAEGSVRHIAPFFLPDGRRFLYSEAAPGGSVGRVIYVGSLDSAEPKKVRDGGSMPAYANGHLLFVEDNALMAQPFDVARLVVRGDATPLGDQIQVGGGPQSSGTFAVSSSGVIAYRDGTNSKSTLAWFDQNGSPQGTISEARGFGYAQLAPDGRHLAVSIREDYSRNRDLWVYDTTRGSRTRLTDEDSDEFSPVWSPDGTQIVYTTARPNDRDLNLYVHNWGTDGDRRLMNRDGIEIPTSWSSDGRFILFQSQSPNADIFIVSVADLKVEPFATSRFSEIGARFSPDGRWIAYASDETGRQEVYVAPTGRVGARTVVSTDGGFAPRWRRDGKELFYVRNDDTLMAVPVHAGAATVDVGSPRRLFQSVFQSRLIAPFDVASDGRLVVTRDVVDPTPPAITLIINWPAGLKKP